MLSDSLQDSRLKASDNSGLEVAQWKILFPGGEISFSYEKDDGSLFGERVSYSTEVEVALSSPGLAARGERDCRAREAGRIRCVWCPSS